MPKFSLYLSHSWRPVDVDLNLYVWQAVCGVCNLLVDENVGANPPYYVNRIEEYIRRSDVFIAVLTYRADEAEFPRCSKASLFEVRLAERARKPRFVLYERGVGFTPPAEESEYVRYVGFDRADVLNLGASDADRQLAEWLRSMKAALKPRRLMFHAASLVLLPENETEVHKVVGKALRDGGYTQSRSVEPVSTDFEVMNQLATTGLLVAHLPAVDAPDVHVMAHALFLPTIRIARQEAGAGKPELPWYLQGHPAMGYDTDVIHYAKAEELEDPVRERAAAMLDTRKLITTQEDGTRFFEQRRRKPHLVFLSHCLKGDGRRVIDAIVVFLKARHIDCWEYVDGGQSGDAWKPALDAQVAKATLAVVLVSKGFNDSPWCFHEMQGLNQRGASVKMLPFLVGADALPSPMLGHLQHQRLPDAFDAAEQAVLQALQAHLAP